MPWERSAVRRFISVAKMSCHPIHQVNAGFTAFGAQTTEENPRPNRPFCVHDRFCLCGSELRRCR
jgi:hypothetical protein